MILLQTVILTSDEGTAYKLHIPPNDIQRIMANFTPELPAVFLYTTVACATRLRNLTQMENKGVHYDPASKGGCPFLQKQKLS